MDNSQILNQLVNENEKAAFKSMYTDMVTGKAILNPEQLGQFLRYATLPQTILNDAKFELMNRPKKELNRTGINGRVLTNGYNSAGVTDGSNITAADVDFGANELDVKKLKAMCEITDDEKEDNIEQAQFEQTLLAMMGERIGEDLEYWALFGDTTKTSDGLLATNDGWLKLAGQQLKSKGVDSAAGNFDLEKGTVEDMFDSMIKAMPSRFRDRNNLKFYVPFEVEDAYRNLLKSRGTALGDSTQTGFSGLAYKGIPIQQCVTLDAEDARTVTGDVKCTLQDPRNMNYGVYKQITVEPEREAAKENTKYWFRMRADVQYNFTEAAVVASISTEEAGKIQESHKV
ncbi:phage major capsid protein [Methanobrevibacter wolinii]|uniref:phage major capsid protein n=1 Tax=Methanobrevibacter wolinii TaxID=190977 RepID=UPI0005B26E20|nr:phage major capsid protein [Methanobrevibacter wolinii]